MKIILFDGVCNFCNSTVNFILKRDKDKVFHFAPLQSEKGKELLAKHNRLSSNLKSLVFIDEDELLEGVDAVTGIAKYLPGYSLAYRVLKILPNKLTSKSYSLIAKHRYRWFGKREQCRMPSPEEKERFL